MDNLLLKTLTFLFIPEASLSVAFLVIFILLFVWGYKVYQKSKITLDNLKEQAPHEYKQISTKMSPELYLKRKFASLSDEEGRLEGLPNSFVSVGILATFIGLGIAIQGAASLLNESTIDLTKMTEVLGVIAFKFQTSIWGIAFSLVFQSVVVDRYFVQKQDVWDNLTQGLYQLEGDSSRKLLERQNDLLKAAFDRQNEENKEFKELVVQEFNRFHVLINDVTKEFNEKYQAILEIVVSQDTKLEKILGSMADFIKASIDFEKIAGEFEADVKKLESNLHIQLQEINGTLSANENDIKDFLADFDMKHKEALTYILHEKEALQKVFIRSSKESVMFVREAVENLLEENREQIHDTYFNAVDSLQNVVSKVDGSIGKIEIATGNIDKSVSNMKEAIEKIQEGSENSSSRMNDVIEKSGDHLRKIADECNEIFNKQDNKLNTLTDSISKNNDYSNVILKSYQDLQNAIDMQSIVFQELRTQIKEWDKFPEKINALEDKYVTVLANSVSEQNKYLTQKIVECISQYGEIVKKYEQEVQRQNEQVGKLIASIECTYNDTSKQDLLAQILDLTKKYEEIRQLTNEDYGRQ